MIPKTFSHHSTGGKKHEYIGILYKTQLPTNGKTNEIMQIQ